MPDGGKCIGFVGLPGADNARERIEGIKQALEGSKVELIDVRGDDIDQTRAKKNVEDALAANPDISCLVGIYPYNTPRIYEVLKDRQVSSARSRLSVSTRIRSRSEACAKARSKEQSCRTPMNGATRA